MSKAARIRDLYAQGLATGEIAKIVGCRPEYVRVVARQRDEKGYSRADKTWMQKRWGGTDVADMLRRRYAQDESYRTRIKQAVKDWKQRKRAEVASGTRIV